MRTQDEAGSMQPKKQGKTGFTGCRWHSACGRGFEDYDLCLQHEDWCTKCLKVLEEVEGVKRDSK